MPGITLDLSDTAELAETLTDSLASFVGHPACNTATLCADLHRFAFLPGASDGEELFGEPAAALSSSAAASSTRARRPMMIT